MYDYRISKEYLYKELCNNGNLNCLTREKLIKLFDLAYFEFQTMKDIEYAKNSIKNQENSLKGIFVTLKKDRIGLRVIWLIITILWFPILCIYQIGWKELYNKELYNELARLPEEIAKLQEAERGAIIFGLIIIGLTVFLPIFFAIRGLLRVPKKRKKRIQHFEKELEKLNKYKKELIEKEKILEKEKIINFIPIKYQEEPKIDYFDYNSIEHPLRAMKGFVEKQQANNWKDASLMYDQYVIYFQKEQDRKRQNRMLEIQTDEIKKAKNAAEWAAWMAFMNR
jgi:hypothetical protein